MQFHITLSNPSKVKILEIKLEKKGTRISCKLEHMTTLKFFH